MNVTQQQHSGKSRGFTLIELLVVMVIVAITVSVVVPRFSSALLSDPLKRSGRQVVTLLQTAREHAMNSSHGCAIAVDVSGRTLNAICPESIERSISTIPYLRGKTGPVVSVNLPEGIVFDSIWNGRNERLTPESDRLWMNRFGQMEPSIINLRGSSGALGLVISPFSQMVKIEDRLLTPTLIQGVRR